MCLGEEVVDKPDHRNAYGVQNEREGEDRADYDEELLSRRAAFVITECFEHRADEEHQESKRQRSQDRQIRQSGIGAAPWHDDAMLGLVGESGYPQVFGFQTQRAMRAPQAASSAARSASLPMARRGKR